MKVLGLALSALILLTTPAIAVEYQGKNMDGRKFAAKAYYSNTGGVYKVQVQFKQNRATIYFSDGYQTTIRLRNRTITDPNDIEGVGRPGLFPIGGIFSAGLDFNNNNIGNLRFPGSRPLEGFWRISLQQALL